jgi:hypothetical protein
MGGERLLLSTLYLDMVSRIQLEKCGVCNVHSWQNPLNKKSGVEAPECSF